MPNTTQDSSASAKILAPWALTQALPAVPASASSSVTAAALPGLKVSVSWCQAVSPTTPLLSAMTWPLGPSRRKRAPVPATASVRSQNAARYWASPQRSVCVAVAGAAANALPDAVPEAVKEERYARFMEVQAGISREKLAAKVGSKMIVLVDAVEEEAIIARGPGDAPEIDGNVILPPEWDLEPGDFVEVEITGSDEHDLFAEPAVV